MIFMVGLVSCYSEQQNAELIETRCTYEGLTHSGQTLAVIWSATEYRCWRHDTEKRPKRADSYYGNCGASLFNKELRQAQTHTSHLPDPVPIACAFTFEDQELRLTVKDDQTMEVQYSNDETALGSCTSRILQDESGHGTCHNWFSSIRLGPVYQEDADIFHVGRCERGQTPDTYTHYWTFDRESQTADRAQEQCLTASGRWTTDDPWPLGSLQGQCIQRFEKGLVSSDRNKESCEDSIEIFRVLTQ
jgi:hypothetical protein